MRLTSLTNPMTITSPSDLFINNFDCAPKRILINMFDRKLGESAVKPWNKMQTFGGFAVVTHFVLFHFI